MLCFAYRVEVNKRFNKGLIMGENMIRALRFGNKYNGWHTYSKHCNITLTAIAKLTRLGYAEINRFRQFRIVRMPIDGI